MLPLHRAVPDVYPPSALRDIAACRTYDDAAAFVIRQLQRVGVNQARLDGAGGMALGVYLHARWIRDGRHVVRVAHEVIGRLLDLEPAAEVRPPPGVIIIEHAPHPRLTYTQGMLGIDVQNATTAAMEPNRPYPYVGCFLVPEPSTHGVTQLVAFDGPGGELAMLQATTEVRPDGGDDQDRFVWNLLAALGDRRLSHVVELPRHSIERQRAARHGARVRRLVLTDDLRGVWVTRKIGPPAHPTPAANIDRGPVAVHVCHAHTARRWMRAPPEDAVERDADGQSIRRVVGDAVYYAVQVPVREHVRGSVEGVRVEKVS